MTNGIDISKHNSKVNWGKVSAGFVMLRAGYGKLESQKDERFEENYSGAKKQKIPIGAYWYNYAATAAEAKEEAKACLACIKGKSFDLPVYYDIEEEKVLKLGKSRVSAIAKAFLGEVEKAGYKVGIYATKSSLETLVSDDIKEKYSVWLAHVGKGGTALSKTSYKGKYDIWQYSWKGKVDGISGDVDLDHCYLDIQSDSKAEEKPETAQAEKTVSELAQEVIAGKWGNGEARKEALSTAGYNYTKVQAEVNKLLGNRKKTHTVKQGDTLSALAGKYGTTVQKLVSANKARYPKIQPNYIVVGWNLDII